MQTLGAAHEGSTFLSQRQSLARIAVITIAAAAVTGNQCFFNQVLIFLNFAAMPPLPPCVSGAVDGGTGTGGSSATGVGCAISVSPSASRDTTGLAEASGSVNRLLNFSSTTEPLSTGAGVASSWNGTYRGSAGAGTYVLIGPSDPPAPDSDADTDG